MKMSEIRHEMHEIALRYGIPRLAELAEETRRQFHGRAPSKSVRLRASDKLAIRSFVYTHPTWPLQDVAEKFGVNIGRISEVLHGERT